MSAVYGARCAAAVVLALAVAGCTPTATEGVVKARAAGSGPMGMFQTDAVTVSTPGAFKGLNRVAIGSFIVGFSTYDTSSVRSRGGGSAARNTLVGVDGALMQRVTDEAYAGLVRTLTAQGYTVVDRAGLAADPRYASTKTYPNPYEDSSGGLFGDRSRVSYVSPTGFGGVRVFAGDIQGTIGGFGPDNPAAAPMAYAAASGTQVLHAVYVLGFVNATGGMRLTSMVEVGQGITARPVVTKLGVVGGAGGTFSNGSGTVSLGQPVTSEREFAFVQQTTTGGAKAAEAAVNVLTALAGVGGSVARDFDFTVRPGDYVAAAGETLNQVTTALVSKAAALR